MRRFSGARDWLDVDFLAVLAQHAATARVVAVPSHFRRLGYACSKPSIEASNPLLPEAVAKDAPVRVEVFCGSNYLNRSNNSV
jgi:hypothetical protein